MCGLTSAAARPVATCGGAYLPRLSLSRRVSFTDRFTETVSDLLGSLVSASARSRMAGRSGTQRARLDGSNSGCGVPPRWCREDPAACRAGSRVVEKQGRRAHRRGVRGGSPGCATVLQVPAALVLVVSPGIGACAPPFPGVHPLAVGHPPGSGLGSAGEGGAPHCLTDLRPRGQVCVGDSLLGLSWPMARG
jgi:hypothetical protein